MNKKGQDNNILGFTILAFVVIIVGLALLTSSTTNIGQSVNTYAYAENGVVPAAAGEIKWMTGQSLLSTPTVINQSAVQNCASNVTFAEGVNPTTGVKAIKMTTNALWTTAECSKLNITYTYGGDGYIDDSGGRAIANLIPIFFVLAIAIVALVPTLRNGALNLFGK
jgi:hypothetical protein